MIAAGWLVEFAEAIEIVVHVVPGAKRTETAGRHGDALRIRLAAPAVDGKANAALIAFIAYAFGVPARNVSLLRGATSRRKRLRIDSPSRRPDRQWDAGTQSPPT